MHTITLLLQSYDFSKKLNELLLVKYAKQALYAKNETELHSKQK